MLDRGGDRRRGRGSFEGNQWGLCGVVILCRERWQRSSSQITLHFLFVIVSVATHMTFAVDYRMSSGLYNSCGEPTERK